MRFISNFEETTVFIKSGSKNGEFESDLNTDKVLNEG